MDIPPELLKSLSQKIFIEKIRKYCYNFQTLPCNFPVQKVYIKQISYLTKEETINFGAEWDTLQNLDKVALKTFSKDKLIVKTL